MAYASKYYDPVKRHEYYMKHRKLKGKKSRTSTAGLNEEGKIAAKEVKEAIMAEKKAYLEKQKGIMNNQIKSLREKLKAMSKEERKKNKAKIQEQIKGLRALYKDHKAKVKDFYNEKYAQELDKIKADKGMLRAYKSKKNKSKKNKKSS